MKKELIITKVLNNNKLIILEGTYIRNETFYPFKFVKNSMDAMLSVSKLKLVYDEMCPDSVNLEDLDEENMELFHHIKKLCIDFCKVDLKQSEECNILDIKDVEDNDKNYSKSHLFDFISYDKEQNLLLVKFEYPSILYSYENVPISIFEEFSDADSQGSYFNKNIRNSYEFKKITDESTIEKILNSNSLI